MMQGHRDDDLSDFDANGAVLPVGGDAAYVAHHGARIWLSPTPGAFDSVFEAVSAMQRTQPNYSAADLANIRVRVRSVLGEGDEFITETHAAYIAATIPGADFVRLPGVSHFAPLQRPEVFNAAMLDFLGTAVPWAPESASE